MVEIAHHPNATTALTGKKTHTLQMIGTVVNSVNSAAGVGVVVGTGAAPLQRVTFAAPPDRSGGFASAHPGKEKEGCDAFVVRLCGVG